MHLAASAGAHRKTAGRLACPCPRTRMSAITTMSSSSDDLESRAMREGI